MKQNIWEILAITFFAISLTLFIWGYSHIKNAETTHLNEMKELETKTTIRIKELEMRIQQDSLKLLEPKVDWEKYRVQKSINDY